MVKLIIKTKGMFIDSPGLSPFRTPVEIDITKLNMNIVTSELKRNGIEKYKIISDDSISLEKTINKMIVKKNEVRSHITELEENKLNSKDEILESIKQQQKSIFKIEGLLERFLNSDILTSKTPLEKNRIEKNLEFIKPKKKFDEPVEDFIPTINLDNIKLKGTTSSRKITNKTDLTNIENLKKVTVKGDL